MIAPECVADQAAIRGRESENNNFTKSHSVDNGGDLIRINGSERGRRESRELVSAKGCGIAC